MSFASTEPESPAIVVASDSLEGVEREQWNACVGVDDPFLRHEFLLAFERSGAVGPRTTWRPRYLMVRRGRTLAGALACYEKYDSYGEYIFDWQWADAYRRAGLSYYPKAVAAVPFMPVTGNRILLRPGESFDAVAGLLMDALLDHARQRGLTGLHVLFTTAAEHDWLVGRGLMSRITHQFHWQNRGYRSFEDFLADLRSSKRKGVRKERACVREQGISVHVLAGEAIRAEHMAAMWRFYLDTTERKWSQPYLNQDFFMRLHAECRDRLLLVMAHDGSRWIAGTLNILGGTRLFGRYWGAVAEYPALHFECAYYRLIEYAIEHGLAVVEAGAQGEHKFLRGFAAAPIYSAHWLAHPGARQAIGEFLEREREQNLEAIRRYNLVSPVKPVRSAAAD